MVKTLKDHLIDTFDDLTQDSVKKFTRKLCDRSQEPRVRRGAVEKIKDSLDLADVMVDTFTSKEAVTVTIEILQAIGCNQQAEDLNKATGQAGARGSAEVSPGSSSAPSKGKHFVDKHRSQLINRVTNIDAILDELLQNEIISHNEYNVIRSKNTSSEKMRDLFAGPMLSAGNEGKDALYEALMMLQRPLMKDLGAQ
ncbi:apoptosis-associated speck-like protein containing a CARD [Triplophysa rosa]|uniref:Apoptosis-associated speck-like protein containing a CARD n=1 Tax=Triplophysa rosa TaxID=992332 RepID=A0A9W7WRW0_TRIRA|nr:apoptosis-associated speck-like protein containing a CARD [Triplophysa rosa]KAI7807171.1 Apoptosis-associated speck-like protein containing a CARD [Triplophysa rosa]